MLVFKYWRNFRIVEITHKVGRIELTDASTSAGGAHRQVRTGHRLPVKWQDLGTDTVASYR